MKTMIICAVLIFSFSVASAQATKLKRSTKILNKRAAVRKQSIKNSTTHNAATTFHLSSTSNNTAKATTRFSIADPVIIGFNERAKGEALRIPKSPIIGMPKSYYGLAKGHIFLKNSDATSTGGNTGTGSVGTGSSIGPTGTSGQAIGVNGKTPYAAPDIYGIPGIKAPQSMRTGERTNH